MSFVASLFGASSQLSSDDHWILKTVAPKSHAGTAVSEHTSLTLTAVYRAVAIIADAVSQLPLSVFRKQDDRREEQPKHRVAKMLRRPNPYMTSVVLRNTAQAHALQWGNAYLEVQRTEGGEPAALWPLLPDRTVVETKRPRKVRYRTNVSGETFNLEPNDVLHIPALGFDGLRGYSPVWLARNAVGLGLALEEFGSKFFANDAKSGGFLEHPGKLSEPAQKNIRESLERKSGLDNAHRIKILEEGMTFKSTQIPPEDAQFLLTRQFQTEEIARLFGIPLHMLQSQAKSTSWGSGIAQMSLGFLIYTVEPWLVRWEQELNRKLLTEREQDQGYYIKHNVNALLRSDPNTRGQFYQRALDPRKGWMRRNEVRALEELNPLDEQDLAPFEAEPVAQ